MDSKFFASKRASEQSVSIRGAILAILSLVLLAVHNMQFYNFFSGCNDAHRHRVLVCERVSERKRERERMCGACTVCGTMCCVLQHVDVMHVVTIVFSMHSFAIRWPLEFL